MRLQLSLRATDLPNIGRIRRVKPNAYAVVSNVNSSDTVRGNSIAEIARTEVVAKCNDPEWSISVLLDYTPAVHRRLLVKVFHRRGRTNDDVFVHNGRPVAGAIDPLHPVSSGENVNIIYDTFAHRNYKDRAVVNGLLYDMAQLIQSVDGVAALEDVNGSRVIMRIEESHLAGDSSQLHLQVRGLKFDIERSFLERKHECYCEVRRKQIMASGDTWGVVYRTEPRPKSVNPFWRSRQVDLQQFCNHEMERPIQISVYINDSRGNRSLFGSCETTVTKLMEAICKRGNADTSNAFILRNRDGDKQMGFLVILKANIGVR